MPATRKRSQTARKPSAGTRKTAARKKQTTRRQHKEVGNKRRVSGERSGPAKENGRKTVRSSNKKRAAKKNESAAMKPGRGRKSAAPVISPDAPDEIYGDQLSERMRAGESNPRLPDRKTRNTRSIEPKRPPRTGVAKSRKK